jgi:hypothetical protein
MKFLCLDERGFFKLKQSVSASPVSAVKEPQIHRFFWMRARGCRQQNVSGKRKFLNCEKI